MAATSIQMHIVAGEAFALPGARYEPIRRSWRSILARDTQRGAKVVITKVPVEHLEPSDMMDLLRAWSVLRHIDHDNIAAVQDVWAVEDGGLYVYTACEVLDSDLHSIIRSSQALSDEHCQYFLYQLLRALRCLHSAGIAHTSLRPAGLLVSASCELKDEEDGDARQRPRWYAAPELFLAPGHTVACSFPGDVWSAGCILAELVQRRPLFPGRDRAEEAALALDAVGPWTRRTPTSTSPPPAGPAHPPTGPAPRPRPAHLPQARAFLRKRIAANRARSSPPRRLPQLLPNASPLALDLLQKMLVFNPAKRITVEAALEHPYFAQMRDPLDEPRAHRALPLADDLHGLGREELLSRVLEEARPLQSTSAPQPPASPPTLAPVDATCTTHADSVNA
eukprot:tig00001339_g8263.t1